MKRTLSLFSAARLAVRPLIGLLLAAFLVLPAPMAHGQGVAAKFSVKFKANGGTGTMKKQTFKAGVSQRLRKNAFKRSGGVFVGWAWSKNGTVAYKNRQTVKDLAVGGTVTLYARWAKSTYKVRFKPNGGKGKMSVESFKYGKSKKLSKNRFKRNGYVFRGWSNRANGEAMFSDGQKVKNLTKTGKTIHLFAVWVKKEYTVRPAAPSWVSASDGWDDDVSVEWGASAGATTYDIYRATSSYSTPSWIASTTSTSYTDSDATPGTTYYYWVTASNDAGTSDYSDCDSGYVEFVDSDGSLADALDNRTLTFSTGGDADWFWQSGESSDGSDAAQSGSISHGQSTWLETTVSGPGTVSFWWKVSSESGCDYLAFFVDDNQQSSIGGTDVSWQSASFTVSGSGTHTLRWRYRKDGSVNSGSDCGWVDQVIWTGANTPRDHGKVQLWEGGPNWATTNIGAEEPEDSGLYFWWGDTVGYRREGDAWIASDGSSQNFSFDSGNTPTYGKYAEDLQSEGWTTSAGVLAPAHDAAHVHWGGDWRMPTEQELSDLSSNCDWTWTTRNGVNGYVVSGRGAYSSASIFLPAAGYGDGTSLDYAGSDGDYWSSVPDSVSSRYSWRLLFNSGYHGTGSYGYRGLGQSVRPVLGFTE